MGKVRKDIGEDYRIPKRPINEMFLSLNGSPEDYAFRGVKYSWREDWGEFKEQLAEYEKEMRHAPKYVNNSCPM